MNSYERWIAPPSVSDRHRDYPQRIEDGRFSCIIRPDQYVHPVQVDRKLS
jgi:hypothetical protein